MTKFKNLIAAIALTLPALAGAAAAENMAQLEIAFTGIESPNGQIMGALFDSKEGYENGKVVRAIMMPANQAEAPKLIENLPAGRYAIKAFHDVDGDGKMGANLFGIPTEPYAFSNNARGSMGPAKWEDAAFEVKAGANSHSITIK